ncbi:MAG: quinone oxidoreductase family protein [Alphaproteobacteria bacterium]|jgi:NADPH2:quinone reductase
MYSIVATQPGDISVLQKKEFEISEILPNQVLIKNHSIGVNFIDIYFRKGLYPWPQENNLVLGSEGAGIIEAVGSDVVNLRVGDRVAYAQANNAYATHRILDANLVVRIPDAITFDQAAAAMLKGLTVRYLLKDSFEVKSHHTVLFHAAAGGVGLIAGQWMQVLGAKSIGTAGSDDKCNLAKDHGYGETINYSNEDFLQRVQEITNQSGVDVVYDSVGKDTMFNSFKALKRHGTVVSFGQSSGAYTDLQMTDLAFGSFHLTRPTLFHFYANRNWLENASAELFELISSEKVKLDQVTKYPLENVAQAHTDIENRKTTGSVILEI